MYIILNSNVLTVISEGLFTCLTKIVWFHRKMQFLVWVLEGIKAKLLLQKLSTDMRQLHNLYFRWKCLKFLKVCSAEIVSFHRKVQFLIWILEGIKAKPFYKKISTENYITCIIIKWVASNKKSLLLKIDLKNTQILQLNQNGKYLQK